jgi:hypothetical protein
MRSASSWRVICSSRPAGMREIVDGVIAVMSARSICRVPAACVQLRCVCGYCGMGVVAIAGSIADRSPRMN